MNIDQRLRYEALLPLDEFDRLRGIGSCKPVIPTHKKIIREFMRIYKQTAVAEKVFKPLIYAIKSHSPLSHQFTFSPNNFSHQVFLIVYQVNGLSMQWKEAMKQLSNMDINLTVVANGGLIQKDIDYLLGLDGVCLYERSNFGLDFGAYKDVIIEASKSDGVKKVTLINDSFYFPLFGQVQDVFEKIDDLNEDFIGLVENTNRDFLLDFHYGSFFLQIREPLLKDKGFLGFWMEYKLSESKKCAIENGEKGLSQFVRDSGFSHSVVYKYNDLFSYINKLGSPALLDILDDVILCYLPAWRELQERYKEVLKKEYADTDEWRAHAIEWVDHVVRPFNKTHAAAILYPKVLNMPLLKKDLRTYYGPDTWNKIQCRLSPISNIDIASLDRK